MYRTLREVEEKLNKYVEGAPIEEQEARLRLVEAELPLWERVFTARERNEKLPNDISLRLADENVTELSPTLCQLPGLRNLDLERLSSLREIPRDIRKMKWLRTLSISECAALTGLPSEIGEMPRLESLSVSKCDQLKDIPTEICDLGTLKELRLEQLAVVALPNEFEKFVSLKKLEFINLPLLQLPKKIGHIPTLRELNINNCFLLKTLPFEFVALKNRLQFETSSNGQLMYQEIQLEPCLWKFKTLAEVEGMLEEYVNEADEEERQVRREVAGDELVLWRRLFGEVSLSKENEGEQQLLDEEKSEENACNDVDDFSDNAEEYSDVKEDDSLADLESSIEFPWRSASDSTFVVSTMDPDSDKLTKLSPTLWHLPGLKDLTLSGLRGIDEIPDAIENLADLTHLGVMFCPDLKSLPTQLGCLKSLISLEVGSCEKITELPADLGKLTALKRLRIFLLAVETLPSELDKLISLKYLTIHSCPYINHLPKIFDKLISLEILEMTDCDSLIKVPPYIGDSRSLRKLDLDSSPIASLPHEILKLKDRLPIKSESNGQYSYDGIRIQQELTKYKTLEEVESALKKYVESADPEEQPARQQAADEELKLWRAVFEAYHKGENLPGNLSLVLKNLPITELSPTLWYLPELEELELNHLDKLREIPPEIGNLAALQTFAVLSCNNVKEIPPEIGRLTLLVGLHLRDLTVEELPPQIGDLQRLEFLQIEGLEITEMPSELVKLSKLDSLWVGNCSKLTTLPEALHGWESLTLFELFNLPITNIPKYIGLLENLTTFEIRDCDQLTTLPCEFLELGPRLQIESSSDDGELYYQGKRIEWQFQSLADVKARLDEYVDEGGLNEQKERRKFADAELDIWREVLNGRDAFDEIPSGKKPENQQRGRRSLHLRSWDWEQTVTALSPTIWFLPNLKQLSISGAQIKSLPPQIRYLGALEALILEKLPQLESLPDQVYSLRKLKYLGIEKCDKFTSHTPAFYNSNLILREFMYITETGDISYYGKKVEWKYSSFADVQLALSDYIANAASEEKAAREIVANAELALWRRVFDAREKEEDLPDDLTLTISGQPITELSPTLCYLPRLSGLVIEDAKLRELPVDARYLRALKELSLLRLPITDLPVEVIGLHGLRKLDIKECGQLTLLPCDFLEFRNNFETKLTRDSDDQFLYQGIKVDRKYKTVDEVANEIDRHINSHIRQNRHGLQSSEDDGTADKVRAAYQEAKEQELNLWRQAFNAIENGQPLPELCFHLKFQFPQYISNTIWHLPGLRKLVLEGNGIKIGNLFSKDNVDIATVTHLSIIGHNGFEVSEVYRGIAKLPNLTHLNIIGGSERRDLDFPWDFDGLSNLSLAIKDCPKLTKIYARKDWSSKLKSLAIKNCPNLESLQCDSDGLWSYDGIPLEWEYGTLEAVENALKEYVEMAEPHERPDRRRLGDRELTLWRRVFEAREKNQSLPDNLSLEISYDDVTELSPTLWHIPKLRALTLKHLDKIKEIPPDLGNLIGLRRFKIDGLSSIETLPDEIGNLLWLESCKIQGCRKLTMLPSAIGKLKSVTNFRLDYCDKLKALPFEFLQLKEKLAIASEPNNQFSYQGIKIEWKYRSLEEVIKAQNEYVDSANGNERAAREQAVMEERKLWERLFDAMAKKEDLPADLILEMKDLPVTKLSPTLCHLPKLDKLSLRGFRELEEIPAEIGKLANLADLEIENCTRLVSIPQEVGELSKLTQVRISNCPRLKILPATMGNLGALEKFQLAQVPVAALPPEFGNLSKLKSVDIDFCPNLKTLPSTLGKWQLLTELKISRCGAITHLPEQLGDLSSLMEFKIEKCGRLKELPYEFLKLKERLPITEEFSSRFFHDGIKIKPWPYKNLREVEKNLDEYVDSTSSSNEKGRREGAKNAELALWRKAFEAYEKGDDLPENLSLDLSNTGIRKLSSTLWHLPGLAKLNLDNNRLTHLPEEIRYSTSLTSLSICDNKLQELPSEIQYLTRLTELRASNNQLSTLPPEMCFLPKCLLRVMGNPIGSEALTNIAWLLNEHRNEQGEGPIVIPRDSAVHEQAARWLLNRDAPSNQKNDVREAWEKIEAEYLLAVLDGARKDKKTTFDEAEEEAKKNIHGFRDFVRRAAEMSDARKNSQNFVNRMRDMLGAAHARPKLSLVIFPAATTALNDCGDAISLGMDQIEMELEDHLAEEENWSAKKRLEAGHNRFRKDRALMFANQIGEKKTLRDPVSTYHHLLNEACKKWDMPGPKGMLHQSASDVSLTDLKDFFALVEDHEGDCIPAFGEVQEKYEKKIDPKFWEKNLETTNCSQESRELFAELSAVMKKIRILDQGQGQQLVGFMFYYKPWRTHLDYESQSAFNEITQNVQVHKNKFGNDYEEWKANQHFDDSMTQDQTTDALKSYSYEQAGKAIVLLEEMTLFAHKLEMTQKAIREHLLPELQIGALMLPETESQISASSLLFYPAPLPTKMVSLYQERYETSHPTANHIEPSLEIEFRGTPLGREGGFLYIVLAPGQTIPDLPQLSDAAPGASMTQQREIVRVNESKIKNLGNHLITTAINGNLETRFVVRPQTPQQNLTDGLGKDKKKDPIKISQ